IRYTGYPYISYYASKAGVNHFTRALAVEYASRGIRANTIMPGLMDTPHIYQQVSGYHGSVEEMRAKRDAIPPMKRQGTAWDIAWASVFLASDEARYITGIELPVDGGLHCAAGRGRHSPFYIFSPGRRAACLIRSEKSRSSKGVSSSMWK